MKRKMSKWTECYDYDHHQVVQIYYYQFVYFLLYIKDKENPVTCLGGPKG